MTTTRRSNFSAAIRTTILLAGLGGLLVVIGALIGGAQGATGFLVIALLFNLVMYFFSDRIALRAARAQPVSEQDDPRLYQMVRDLTTRAGLPMPKLYVIPQEQPNAFATGRNPKNSAVAVTAGIRKLLSEDELRGVLAHELGHVRNRDILIQTVASGVGTAITWIAYMLLWFGGDDESPLGAIGAIALALLAPLAATIIQLAISRQRENSADATGAEICGNPDADGAGNRAALHRQALQRRRPGVPLLDASADRGAGPAAPPDAPDHRLDRWPIECCIRGTPSGVPRI